MSELKESIKDAPLSPGCYIMRDEAGKILYIGKARVLRERLRSYFSGAKDIKTATLLKHAASIETIIVSSEYEALLLENTLIKQHSPRYNITLKDGKLIGNVYVENEKVDFTIWEEKGIVRGTAKSPSVETLQVSFTRAKK